MENSEDVLDLEWSDGRPRSKRHGDIYYSLDSGLEESRHVFLQASGIKDLWHERDEITVVETGFGTGLNFLMLWQAWLSAGRPCALRFISVEKYPLSLQEVKRCHQLWSEEFSEMKDEFYSCWPDRAAQGWQRAAFESDCLTLEVFHGDIDTWLSHEPFDSDLKADVWFLDGFSPACNPEMWGDSLFDAMVRCSRQGAVFSTFTAAGFVRRALRDRGYAVEKVPGHGNKREMLRGRLSSKELK